MMPGENKSTTVRIAADATAGDCQNCSVLHQCLKEYVASFLALKQKITDSDHVLSEYQEKCNELQRSQSKTTGLQGQLEELQVKLISLEKQNADYELVRAELEEKKCALKGYGQMSEEMEKLKEENNKTTAQNKKLEDQLKDLDELTEKQTLENAQLKREKASVENDLLKTQASLKTSQDLADQVEKLREQNTKATSIKSNLENQLKQFGESNRKQSHQISQLTREKTLLEGNIRDLQVRMLRLESERIKDFRSVSTQSAPGEPKVDKERFRMLLENLWACVEPQQLQLANTLHFPEANYKQVLPSSPENRLRSNPRSQSASHTVPESQCYPIQPKARRSPLRPTLRVLKAIKCQASLQCTGGKKQTHPPNKGTWHRMDSSTDLDSEEITIDEILELFKSPRPCISPVPDSERGVVSPETEDGEDENSPKPTNDSLPLQQEDSLMITLSESSQHPKSSELPSDQTRDSAVKTEQNITTPGPSSRPLAEQTNLPVVTTEKMEHSLNENDSKHFEQHRMSNGITALEGKRSSTDDGGSNNQEDMQTDQGTETMQLASSSSSSTSDTILLIEMTSLTKSEDPHLNVKPNSSLSVDMSKTPLSHTQNTGVSEECPRGEAEENESAGVAKMDVLPSTCNVVTGDGGESLRGSSDTVDCEAVSHAQTITSKTLTDSMQGSKVTNGENDAEMGQKKDSIGLGQDNSEATEVAIRFQETHVKESRRKYTNVPEDQSCLSEVTVSNNISGVADKKHENDASMKVPEEAHEDEAVRVGEPVSLIESNGGMAPGKLSPHKSPLLNMAGAEDPLTDQESANANEAASSKDVSTETNSTIIAEHNGVSDSQETILTTKKLLVEHCVGCESPPKSMHTLCSQSRHVYLSPTVKPQPCEPHIQPKTSNVDVSSKSEHLTTDVKSQEPVAKLAKVDVVDKAILKDLHKEIIDSSHKEAIRSSISPIVSETTSLKQAIATTNGPNTSVDSCEVALGKVTPDMTEKGPSLTSRTSVSPAKIAAQQSEFIGQVRDEMGPPLPALLTPLSTTPQKMVKAINPKQAIGKLSFPSPMDRLASPTTPVESHMTCNGQQQNSPSLNSPLPPNGVPSSPLQFGSATPKHAVPVPGRLPSSTLNASTSSSSSPSQENSMRMLDTMYPELSARARTLSILRGNVSLSICSSESGTTPTTTVGQISGFKSINSSPTAFTKTELRGEKRPTVSLAQPKSAKWLRLGSCSRSLIRKPVPSSTPTNADETTSPQALSPKEIKNEMTPQSMESEKPTGKSLIIDSLGKIETQCFDLLQVVRSHLYVGNLSKTPVLREEEKEVISEFCHNSSSIAEDMTLAILNKLKTERGALSGDHMQALCRVYTGICRQRKDWERARILAYSILREDFPDSAKLILFMVTTWPNVLSHSSTLCQAVHALTRLKAHGEVLNCLSAYLGWEKSPPCDIDHLISRTVSEIRTGSSLSFRKHHQYGDDLGAETWEHVFTLDLLCTHKKWKWTYNNVLGKELWPLMNSWVTQPRDQQTPISDVTVATVLRLIGRLGHLGLKERCVSSVISVADVINTLGRHAHTEGLPWEVQLAAVYCIYDLSPCDPKQALEALALWRGETIQKVPPAVTSCINQLASVCRQVKS